MLVWLYIFLGCTCECVCRCDGDMVMVICVCHDLNRWLYVCSVNVGERTPPCGTPVLN